MAISDAPARLMIDITFTVSPKSTSLVAAQNHGLIGVRA